MHIVKRLTSTTGRLRPRFSVALASFIGGACGIFILGGLSNLAGDPLLMAPFGATCVLLFAAPESAFAQPRAVIGGQVIATIIALGVLSIFGTPWWAMPLAVGAAMGAMQLTHTVHPPAGATPIVILLSAPGWRFLVTPVVAGSATLVLVAFGFHNLARRRSYPQRWF
jgi:CBS-domain-containing membrane protein